MDKKKKQGKGRQLFGDVVKKVMNNNKNKNDKPQPKKDGNKELDALKKACQKNALCKKLMECKMKAQKGGGGGGKPADACKKELAACNKDKVRAALHKKLAKAMADSKKGQKGKPQDKKKDPKKQPEKKKPDDGKKKKPDDDKKKKPDDGKKK